MPGDGHARPRIGLDLRHHLVQRALGVGLEGVLLEIEEDGAVERDEQGGPDRAHGVDVGAGRRSPAGALEVGEPDVMEDLAGPDRGRDVHVRATAGDPAHADPLLAVLGDAEVRGLDVGAHLEDVQVGAGHVDEGVVHEAQGQFASAAQGDRSRAAPAVVVGDAHGLAGVPVGGTPSGGPAGIEGDHLVREGPLAQRKVDLPAVAIRVIGAGGRLPRGGTRGREGREEHNQRRWQATAGSLHLVLPRDRGESLAQ